MDLLIFGCIKSEFKSHKGIKTKFLLLILGCGTVIFFDFFTTLSKNKISKSISLLI